MMWRRLLAVLVIGLLVAAPLTGALGNPEVKTPVLDVLVRTGYRFDNCYCQGSWSGAVCLPSRIMMADAKAMRNKGAGR